MAMDFLKITYASQLDGYHANNIHEIIETLDRKRSTPPQALFFDDNENADDVTGTAPQLIPSPLIGEQQSQTIASRRRDRQTKAKATLDAQRQRTTSNDSSGTNSNNGHRERHLATASRNNSTTRRSGSIRRSVVRRRSRSIDRTRSMASVVDGSPNDEDIEIVVVTDDDDDDEGVPKDVAYNTMKFNGSRNDSNEEYSSLLHMSPSPPPSNDQYGGGGYTYAQRLLKIAHVLHYIGIGILAFFVIQVIR